MTAQSFQISSQPFLCTRWPRPTIAPAVQWTKSSSGNPRGSDRGAAQDVFETQIRFWDTETAINTLQTTLESNRGLVTLSAFGEDIFAPIVDHSGSLSCVMKILDMRKETAFAQSSNGMFEMSAAVRAVSPALVSTTPSLAALRLQHGYTADKSYESRKVFSYDQTSSIMDSKSDSGLFVGLFLQTTTEMQAILGYILATARAAQIDFPTIGSVTYPFGVVRGALPKKTRITAFDFSRKDFTFWNLSITFAEDV